MRDPIFAVFMDDHLIAKIKLMNRLNCTVHDGHELVYVSMKMAKINHP